MKTVSQVINERARVLAFIQTFSAANGGSAPTVREIAKEMSSGLGYAHRILRELEEGGYIARGAQARSIRVLKPILNAQCCAACGQPLPMSGAAA